MDTGDQVGPVIREFTMILEVLREMACTSQVRLCAPVMPALKKPKHKDYNVIKISSREGGFC